MLTQGLFTPYRHCPTPRKTPEEKSYEWVWMTSEDRQQHLNSIKADKGYPVPWNLWWWKAEWMMCERRKKQTCKLLYGDSAVQVLCLQVHMYTSHGSCTCMSCSGPGSHHGDAMFKLWKLLFWPQCFTHGHEVKAPCMAMGSWAMLPLNILNLFSQTCSLAQSMHFSSKLPIVFIQSCFTMASSGAAPLLPASGAGLPFEIPTPSHSPFQIESRSSSYWPLRQDDLLRMMPEPQRDQAWHVLPAKFKLEPSGDGGHYLACQYANGWEERRLWNYFN